VDARTRSREADEVPQMRIAQRAIAAFRKDGKTHAATGDLPI
jgi:hypothetical protein